MIIDDNTYWNIRTRHTTEHKEYPDQTELIIFDKACEICHPRRPYPNKRFIAFWNWITSIYPVITYSGLSEDYLDRTAEAFEINESGKANLEVIRLIYSLGFRDRFNLGVIYKHTFAIAYLSNTFDINPSDTEHIFALTTTTSSIMSITPDQLTAILNQVQTTLGTSLAGLTVNATVAPTVAAPKESNIVKVDFSGTINEDPNEWIENFERAKDANNWHNDRLRFIAGGLMKGEAADWYQADKANIT